MQFLIWNDKRSVCLEFDRQGILLPHSSSQPFNCMRQAFSRQDRRAQIYAEVANNLHDFTNFLFDIGHFPPRSFTLYWKSVTQEGHLHLNGINTLLQIIV